MPCFISFIFPAVAHSQINGIYLSRFGILYVLSAKINKGSVKIQLSKCRMHLTKLGLNSCVVKVIAKQSANSPSKPLHRKYGQFKITLPHIAFPTKLTLECGGVNNENNTSKCPNKPHTSPLMLICRSCSFSVFPSLLILVPCQPSVF